MQQYLNTFDTQIKTIKIVKSIDDFRNDDNITYFDVSTRQYTKKRSEEETAFMRFLLPDKAKFTPFIF